METVALEWMSSTEVEAHDVILFMQHLANVPEKASCEIGAICSRRCGNSGEKPRIRSEILLSCDASVAVFLCHKFSKPTPHVAHGEVIQVRCKRVYPGQAALQMKHKTQCVTTDAKSSALQRMNRAFEGREYPEEASCDFQGESPTVLPIEKVMELLDRLGDRVVDALEAYELFAVRDVQGPRRMTMLGLTKALNRLGKSATTAERSTSLRPARCDVKPSVESLRQVLPKLVASNTIAVQDIPAPLDVPFLSYTDFLATYVAFLAMTGPPLLPRKSNFK